MKGPVRSIRARNGCECEAPKRARTYRSLSLGDAQLVDGLFQPLQESFQRLLVGAVFALTFTVHLPASQKNKRQAQTVAAPASHSRLHGNIVVNVFARAVSPLQGHQN